jgi:hypothetical protein
MPIFLYFNIFKTLIPFYKILDIINKRGMNHRQIVEKAFTEYENDIKYLSLHSIE